MTMLLISPLAILVLVALLFVVVRGLANVRTRPFVIGIAVIPVLAVIFFALTRPPAAVQVAEVQVAQQNAQAQLAQAQARISTSKEASPPSGPATETKRPRMTLLAALRQAVVRALNARTVAPTAEAPDQPVTSGQADAPLRSQPPAWVNAAPKMEDNCYLTKVQVGPFMTPLECEQDLPNALHAAVAKYAELSLGPEAAAVRLSDDDLKKLVRDRWTEVRPMQIGDGSQDMVTLYAQVVFDVPMQQRIKSEADRLVSGRRVKGAAVVLGGVLGFLALAWGGLRLATRKLQAESKPA